MRYKKRGVSKSKGRGSRSHRTRTPSDSKSNRSNTSMICPLCGEGARRDQELRRHIIDIHLPDWICCPACSWHGSRKDALHKHIKVCGVNPELGEYKIYDPKLMLRRFLSDTVPFETVETLALGCIEEKARELKKVDAWGPLTRWRKQTIQVLLIM